jgi:hypothetical protein
MEKLDRKVDLSVKASRLPLQPRVDRNPPDQNGRTILELLPDLVEVPEQAGVAKEVEGTRIPVIKVITTKTTHQKTTMKKRKSLTKTSTLMERTKLQMANQKLDLRIPAVLPPKVIIGTLTKL